MQRTYLYFFLKSVAFLSMCSLFLFTKSGNLVYETSGIKSRHSEMPTQGFKQEVTGTDTHFLKIILPDV